MRLHGVLDNCFVPLVRNMQAECLLWLAETEPNAPNEEQQLQQQLQQQAQLPSQASGFNNNRRASVASTNVFAIGNEVVEAGFDHFQRVPNLSSAVVSHEHDQEVPSSPTQDNRDDHHDSFDSFEASLFNDTFENRLNITAQNNESDATVANAEVESKTGQTVATVANTEVDIQTGEIDATATNAEIDMPTGQAVATVSNTEVVVPTDESDANIKVDAPTGATSTKNANTEENVPTNATVAPKTVKLVLANSFNPFRRLPNPAFTINGRQRALSVDSRPTNEAPIQAPTIRQRRPSFFAIPRLDTISEDEFGDNIEHLFD